MFLSVGWKSLFNFCASAGNSLLMELMRKYSFYRTRLKIARMRVPMSGTNCLVHESSRGFVKIIPMQFNGLKSDIQAYNFLGGASTESLIADNLGLQDHSSSEFIHALREFAA